MSDNYFNNISFLNTFKTSIAVFKRKYYEILLLTSLPFLAFTLMYIYSGDFSIESISNIPVQILYSIYFILLSSYLIVFPTTISLTMDDLQVSHESLTNKFIRVLKRLPKMMFGFLIMFLFIFLLVLTLLLVISLVGDSIASFAVTVFTIVCIKLLIDFIFFQHGVMLKDLKTLQAFRHSKVTVSKNWWRVFIILVVLELIIFTTLNLASLAIASIVTNQIVFRIIIAFLQSLFVVFTQIFTTVVYASLNRVDSTRDF